RTTHQLLATLSRMGKVDMVFLLLLACKSFCVSESRDVQSALHSLRCLKRSNDDGPLRRMNRDIERSSGGFDGMPTHRSCATSSTIARARRVSSAATASSRANVIGDVPTRRQSMHSKIKVPMSFVLGHPYECRPKMHLRLILSS